MTKPAVLQADFTSYKPVPSRKVLQLVFEVPLETQAGTFATLGYPTPGESTWVAIARLQAAPKQENGPDAVVTPVLTPSAAVEGQDRPSKFTRSNLAGVKCKEPAFQDWLFGNTESDLTMSQFLTRDDLADAMLKEHLGITSKRELDTLPHKAEAFDRMITTFKNRDLIR